MRSGVGFEGPRDFRQSCLQVGRRRDANLPSLRGAWQRDAKQHGGEKYESGAIFGKPHGLCSPA
jgi:hypothetical protein